MEVLPSGTRCSVFVQVTVVTVSVCFLVQVFVETLDKCFENVCELDLIFHMDKVSLTVPSHSSN